MLPGINSILKNDIHHTLFEPTIIPKPFVFLVIKAVEWILYKRVYGAVIDI